MASHPEILEGFVDVPTFAEKVNSCPTVDRWTRNPDGLPYTKLGTQINLRGDYAAVAARPHAAAQSPRTQIPSGNVKMRGFLTKLTTRGKHSTGAHICAEEGR